MQRPKLEQRLRDEKGSFLLSGAGGTGKTTELQRLYLDICKKTIFNLSKGKVPVFMSSRWINQDIEFVEDTLRLHFERDSYVTEKQIDSYLKSSRIIIIVDGLDELEPEQRKKVCQVLEIFKHKWPGNQLIVSTREYDSEAIANELGLNIVIIPKLTDEEVEHLSKIYEQYRMKKT
jgi:predicted NACHT family NTPase